MSAFAWVTLATNDSYSLGALVLAHSLRHAGTIHQLAVLVTPGVSSAMRDQLAGVFDLVQEVNVLDSKDDANLALLARPDLGITFTKLHCWTLTQYSKCVFLDADTLVLQHCDELFDREEFSAAPDVGWPDCFNSGVFVYRPSVETFKRILDMALTRGSFDGGDQGLLNLFFSDWATQDASRRLPFIYNMCSMATYSYLPAFKQFGSEAKIVHFIGPWKPWLLELNTQTGLVNPMSDNQHLLPLLQQWWSIFLSEVLPKLQTDMGGMAGALAQLVIGNPRSEQQRALEQHWRRQAWEHGHIDYLGRDSFDKIWAKILETLSATHIETAALPEHAPQPTDQPDDAQLKVEAEAAQPGESEEPTLSPASSQVEQLSPGILPPLVLGSPPEHSVTAQKILQLEPMDPPILPLSPKSPPILPSSLPQSPPVFPASPPQSPPVFPASSPILPASPPHSPPILPSSPPKSPPILASSPPQSPPIIPVTSPILPSSPPKSPPILHSSPPKSPPILPSSPPKSPPKLSSSPPQSPPIIPVTPPILPASPPKSPPILPSSPPKSPPILPSSPPKSPPILPSSLPQSQPVFPASSPQSPPIFPASPPQSPPILPTSPPHSPPILPLSPPKSPPILASPPKSPVLKAPEVGCPPEPTRPLAVGSVTPPGTPPIVLGPNHGPNQQAQASQSQSDAEPAPIPPKRRGGPKGGKTAGQKGKK